MSGAEHKTHRDEPSGESNVQDFGKFAGGALSMVGRTTESVMRGAEEWTINPLDTAMETVSTTFKQITGMVRGLVRNTLAPLVVLKDDEGFFKKLGNSLKEIPVSMIWGNVKNAAVGTVGVAKTVLGVDSMEGKLRFNDMGVSGLVKSAYYGLKDVVTSPLGLPTNDPAMLYKCLAEQAQESMASQRADSLPKFMGGTDVGDKKPKTAAHA